MKRFLNVLILSIAFLLNSYAQLFQNGDVNHDGNVTISDLVCVAEMLNGKQEIQTKESLVAGMWTTSTGENVYFGADGSTNYRGAVRFTFDNLQNTISLYNSEVELIEKVSLVGSHPFNLFLQTNDGQTDVFSSPKCEIFQIMNPDVYEYFNTSTADLSGNPANYTDTFFSQQREYRPDQPNVKTITFDAEDEPTVQVLLSLHPDFSSPILNKVVDASAGSFVLKNFIPNLIYYYLVKTADGRILTTGSIFAEGQIRMIAIDNGFNIRDLGGWKGLCDKRIKYGQIYRGGSLGGVNCNGDSISQNGKSILTDEDKLELQRLGIKAQLDLRAPQNKGKYLNEWSNHSYSRGYITFPGADYNNKMTDYGAYNEDASLVSDIAWIIYELKRGRPVYFNCRQGADRTGIIAFLIEGLLGCYGDDAGHQIAMDYELTSFSQANPSGIDPVYVSCYRPCTNLTDRTSAKLFAKLQDLQSDDPDIVLTNLQERCYYYLNRYWKNRIESQWGTVADANIDSEDLDWFIKYMLDLTDEEYEMFKPSFAIEGNDLKTLGERNSNAITYYP